MKPEYITQLHLNSWSHSSKESSTSTCDLRRTINALQVACLTEVETTSSLTFHGDDTINEIASAISDETDYNKPRLPAKATEAKSYIDGVLRGDSPQLFAVGSSLSSG